MSGSFQNLHSNDSIDLLTHFEEKEKGQNKWFVKNLDKFRLQRAGLYDKTKPEAKWVGVQDLACLYSNPNLKPFKGELFIRRKGR